VKLNSAALLYLVQPLRIGPTTRLEKQMTPTSVGDLRGVRKLDVVLQVIGRIAVDFRPIEQYLGVLVHW
jgi:hypothetical protein